MNYKQEAKKVEERLVGLIGPGLTFSRFLVEENIFLYFLLYVEFVELNLKGPENEIERI